MIMGGVFHSTANHCTARKAFAKELLQREDSESDSDTANMAKNAHSKKKRITHMESGAPDIQYAGEPNSNFDIFSIIEKMQDSYSSVNVKEYSELIKKKNHHRLNTPNNSKTRISAAPCSSNSQAEKSAVLKFKKLSSTRKFPLMEKTQKTLKQLKHNRSLPKPRAHVSSFIAEPPVKSDAEIELLKLSRRNIKRPTQKGKVLKKKDPTVTKPRQKVTASKKSKSTVPNVKQNSSRAQDTRNCNVKQGEQNSSRNFKSKKICDTKQGKFEAKKISPKTNNQSLNESTKNEPSDGDTTDSEYERFIKCNKVEEKPKKVKKKPVKKKTKIMKKKSKPLKKSSSTESIPDQYDSNFHDYSSDEDFHQNTCTETNNIGYSATVNGASGTAIQHPNDASEDSRLSLKSVNNFDSTFQKDDSCYIQISDLPPIEIISAESSKLEASDKNLEVLNNPLKSDHPCIEDSTTTKHAIKDEQPIKSSEKHLLKVENIKNELTSVNKDLLQPGNLKQINDKILPKVAETIDLCDSDSEVESAETSNSVLSSTLHNNNSDGNGCSATPVDSEESDIEILEIVPVLNKKQASECKKCTCDINKNIAALDTDKHRIEEFGSDSQHKNDIGHALTSAITTVKNIVGKVIKPVMLENSVTGTSKPVEECLNIKKETVESAVKMEVIEDVVIKEVEKHVKKEIIGKPVKKELVESNNPVYVTNICQGLIESEAKCSMNDSMLKKSVPSIINVSNQNVNNIEDDDDIMIIESDAKLPTQPIDKSVVPKSEKNNDISIDFASIKKESVVENVSISPNQHSSLKRKSESLDSHLGPESFTSCSKIPKIGDMQSTFIENEPALYKLDSSGTQSYIGETISGDTKVKLDTLLKMFKTEFQTYQELIDTEAKARSFENSLKFLEKQQAEKLLAMRSVIHNLVKNNQVHSTVGCSSSGSKIHMSSQAEISLNSCVGVSGGNLLGPIPSNFSTLCIKAEETKPDMSRLNLPVSVTSPSVEVKSEPPENTQMLGFFGKKCDVCGKEAVAACQRCAKAFFCSDKCGKQFWNSGHEKVCGT